jgi:hypothetical protein
MKRFASQSIELARFTGASIAIFQKEISEIALVDESTDSCPK